MLGQCVRVEVDGQGYVGIVEGVDFSDSSGASVFVGERYYPLSSITNVYYLTEAAPDGDGSEGAEGTEDEEGSSGDNSSDSEGVDAVSQAVQAAKSATALNALSGGNLAQKAYEYAKQTIDDIKGQ